MAAHLKPYRSMLVVAVGALGLGILVSHRQTQRVDPDKSSSTDESGLAISEEDLDIGEVWDGDTREVPLHLTNTGLKRADIAGWNLSCSCLSVVPSSLSLTPNERTNLRATIDLSARRSGQKEGAHNLVVPFQAKTVNGGIIASSKTWSIKAKVRPFLELQNSQPLLVTKSIATTGSISADVFKLVEVVPLSDVEPVFWDGPIKNIRRIQDIDHRDTYEFKIEWNSIVAVGDFPFTISIQAKTKSEGNWLKKRVTGILSVTEDYVHHPKSVLITGYESKAIEEVVELESLTLRPFEIVMIEEDQPDSTIQVSRLGKTKIRVRVGAHQFRPRMHRVVLSVMASGRITKHLIVVTLG